MPRYEIRVELGHAHGGLYELEQQIWHEVYDTREDRVVLRFAGELEATLSTDGDGWTDLGGTGIVDVKVERGRYAVATRGEDDRTLRWRLSDGARWLVETDFAALEPLFRAWRAAHDAWKTGEAWSFDVSIPQKAIEADRKRARTEKKRLDALLERLMVDPDAIPAWPKRLEPAHRQICRWLQAGRPPG